MTRQRQQIVSLLKRSDKPLSPKEIAEKLKKKHGNIRKLLHCLLKDGRIIHLKYGKYWVDKGNTLNGNTSSNDNLLCPGRDLCSDLYILKPKPFKGYHAPCRWCIVFNEWCKEEA